MPSTLTVTQENDPAAPDPSVIEGLQSMDESLRLTIKNIMNGAY